MNNDEDRNYVSVGTWMLIIFCMAVPIIGVIIVLFGAFTGENESRKNYFRAILAWVFIIIAFTVIMVLLGASPDVAKHIHSWMHKQ